LLFLRQLSPRSSIVGLESGGGAGHRRCAREDPSSADLTSDVGARASTSGEPVAILS